MIALLLFLAQLVLQLVLGVVVLGIFAVVAWVLWDCTVGPSARMAREHARRRAPSGVDGR